MTDELGPGSRMLLDAARDGMSPDAAAIRRMRANIAAATGGGAASGGSSGGGVLGGKLALVGALAGAVAAIGVTIAVVVSRGDPPVARPPLAVATEAVSAERAVAGDDAIEIDEVNPRAEAPAPRSPIAPPARATTPSRSSPRTRVAPRATDATAGATTAPESAGLAREVELVDLAMAALRRGDTTTALAAVHRHASETAGHGQLAEDAAAIEVEALCQRHDATAAARLAAFDARFPRSAQRTRLLAACR